MLFFANPVGSDDVKAAMTNGQIGMIATPAQGQAVPEGAPWCADNGCFGKGYPGDDRFLLWLAKNADRAASCAFATAPDVVGDAAATLVRSAPFLPKIRALGYRAALVAQDGLEDLPIPWDTFDVLFIGGSTDWKLGPAAREIVAQAKARRKYVHMGRVNSERRFRYASAIGCDSVDGTHLVYEPTAGLRHVLAWSRLNAHEPLTFEGEPA